MRDEFLRQRERWILWTPVALACGIGGYFSLHAEPPLWAGIMSLGALAVLGFLVRRQQALLLLWMPPFLIVLGFAAAQMRTVMAGTPLLERKTYLSLTLEGQVAEVEILPKGYRFILEEIRYDPAARLPQTPMPQRVRLSWRSSAPPPPAAGDRVRVRAMLLPLPAPALPGSYDFQRHAFFEGIGATGYLLSHVAVLDSSRQGDFFLAGLRRTMRKRIEAAIADPDRAAVLIALTIGEEKGISARAWQDIRLSGLAHLLSISGLHLSAIAGWLFFLARLLLASVPPVALRWPVKKIAALFSIPCMLFYLALIGFQVPAGRSAAMVCVAMLAIVFDREALSLRLLAFAALLILLLRPESLLSISFQLSFAATAVLISFYESTRDWWSRMYQSRGLPARGGLLVLGSMATTLSATLGTAPYSFYYFSQTPLLAGFAANLVAVPLTVLLILPMGIIACLLMPLGLESWPLQLAGWSIGWMLKVAETVAHWPLSTPHTAAWPASLLVLITLGGLWICLWQGRLRWLGVVPIVAGCALIPFTPRADILVSASGKLFAVRDEAGVLWFSTRRTEKFVRKIWADREAGKAGYAFWTPKAAQGDHAPLSCDGQACLYRRKNTQVSFIKQHTAQAEDCAEAQIVISALPIARQNCRGPGLLIDRRRLGTEGVQALYLQSDGPAIVRSLRGERGDRPWTLPKKPHLPVAIPGK